MNIRPSVLFFFSIFQLLVDAFMEARAMFTKTFSASYPQSEARHITTGNFREFIYDPPAV
jgi:hypothetical protein